MAVLSGGRGKSGGSHHGGLPGANWAELDGKNRGIRVGIRGFMVATSHPLFAGDRERWQARAASRSRETRHGATHQCVVMLAV